MRGKILNVVVPSLTEQQQIAKDLLFEYWKRVGKNPFIEIKNFRAKHPDLPFGQIFEVLLGEQE